MKLIVNRRERIIEEEVALALRFLQFQQQIDELEDIIATKITKHKLKQIIKEETAKALKEQLPGLGGRMPTSMRKMGPAGEPRVDPQLSETERRIQKLGYKNEADLRNSVKIAWRNFDKFLRSNKMPRRLNKFLIKHPKEKVDLRTLRWYSPIGAWEKILNKDAIGCAFPVANWKMQPLSAEANVGHPRVDSRVPPCHKAARWYAFWRARYWRQEQIVDRLEKESPGVEVSDYEFEKLEDANVMVEDEGKNYRKCISGCTKKAVAQPVEAKPEAAPLPKPATPT